jgi:hypothetical protein
VIAEDGDPTPGKDVFFLEHKTARDERKRGLFSFKTRRPCVL